MIMSASEQELKEFRAEAAAWMKDNNPPDPGFLLPQTFMEVGDERQLEFLRQWQHKVWSAGYLGMAWPKQYGGGGVAAVFQSIADQEMRRAGVPICFNVIGLLGGAVDQRYRTEAESEIPKGYPQCGRRLVPGFFGARARLRPGQRPDARRARRRRVRDQRPEDLDHHGQFRQVHDPAGAPIPDARASTMACPFPVADACAGHETRPIRKITGEYGFTETFFTNARIPADCLMGEEGQGWKIAMQTLQYERGAEAGAAGGQAMVRVRSMT
jgi:alkylation response protein AidB-like acyl-CoA dehydrogenase